MTNDSFMCTSKQWQAMAKKYICEPIFVTKAYKWQSDLPPTIALLPINVLFITLNVSMAPVIMEMAPVIMELYTR